MEAAKFYRKAADQGLAVAKANLGVMLFKGIGVERDIVQSVRWTTEAAHQRNSYAQQNLGVLYRDGNGVPLDLVQALMWFDLAMMEGSNEEAAAFALQVAEQLTAEQRVEAKQLALQWIASHHKDTTVTEVPHGLARRTVDALVGLWFYVPILALIAYLLHVFAGVSDAP